MSEPVRRRRGEGSIERITSGRYRVRMGTGNARRSFGTCATQQEADILLDAIRAELVEQQHIQQLTLRAWGARWLDHAKPRDTAPSPTTAAAGRCISMVARLPICRSI